MPSPEVLSPEVLNRLPSIVFWAVIGIFIFGTIYDVLIRVLGGSKAAQAGVLGPLGRWFQRRAKARNKRAMHEDADAPDYKALLRRIDTLERLVKKLEAQIIKHELVEEAHAARDDMNAEFLREDAQYHRDESLHAVEKGFELLPHRSYTKFVRDYRERHGLQSPEWKEE